MKMARRTKKSSNTNVNVANSLRKVPATALKVPVAAVKMPIKVLKVPTYVLKASPETIKATTHKGLKRTAAVSLSGLLLIQPITTFAAPAAASQETTPTQQVAQLPEKHSVMYYGDWSVWGGQGNFYPKDVPADQLTDLYFSFVDFDSQGNLQFTDKDAAVGAPVGQEGVQWGGANAGALSAFQELRAANPNLKLGVSFGGWSKSGDFSAMAADPVARANFVNQVMKFLEYTGFDTVDIDWEYPTSVRQADLVDNKNDEGTPNASPADKENYILLLQDLKAAMDEQEQDLGKEYQLSVALPADKAKMDAGVDVDELFEVVDFANVMTYDMRGAWDSTSGHQTGLYPNPNDPLAGNNLSIDESVEYLESHGAPSEKIVVGAAYYTRGWDEVAAGPDANNPGLYGQASKTTSDADGTPSYGAPNEAPLKSGEGGRAGGVWSYRNLDQLKAQYPGLEEHWDETAQAPYLYDPTTGMFFTYDNPQSIAAKADYVNDNDLGGMIGWMASNDKPTEGTKRDELTKATKQGLFGSADLPEYEIVSQDLDVSVTLTPYTDWSGDGYTVTVKNNEKVEETNAALSSVEKQHETIKAPKFYVTGTTPFTSGGYEAGNVTYKDGVTEVDLSGVYDAQNIEQGKTYTFKLKGTGEITGIDMAQHMSKNGPDMYRQAIYGSGTQTPAENAAPTFSGVANKTITVGDTFNPLTGVTATDKEDGDLTSAIQVTGNVDTNVAGTYTLTYKVKDSKGLETTVTRTVTVKEQAANKAPVLNGVTDKTIEVGTAFDPMAGVTATDVEDGNLTSDIQVTGSVDKDVAGTYTLTYSVTDSKGETTTKDRTITVTTVQAPPTQDSKFGVGQGIEWPEQVNAPFVDFSAWVSKPGYAQDNAGVPNLTKLSEDTGVKYFNLGFIQTTGQGQGDGKLDWGFGGYSVLGEENGVDSTQYQAIKHSIEDLREAGGDVTISFGGASGVSFWQATQNPEVLYNTYKEIVEGYGLTRIDLDIEGSALDYNQNVANAKAIKKLQDETGVEVVITLPVLPTGLDNNGQNALKAYVQEGVDVEVVNLMTMCYGPSSVAPGDDFGDASIKAVDNTMKQVQNIYAQYGGKTLTDEQSYAMLGTTPSVGFESSAFPVFTPEMAQKVVDHAIEKNIAMTSMWSLNRDAQLENNIGVPTQYAFTNIFKEFGQNSGGQVNKAPVLNGVADKTIQVGDTFDPMAGVTATDDKDGNLTSSIEVAGTVDTSKAGTYNLTYKVTDSQGLTTSKVRTITVREAVNEAPVISGATNKTIIVGDEFNPMSGVTATDAEDGDLTSSIEVTGTVDTSNAGTYHLTYKVTDSKGVTTQINRTITVNEAQTPPTGGSAWEEGKVYLKGDTVTYNGKTYEAQWWTTATPGTDSSWKLIVELNGDGSQDYVPGAAYNKDDIVNYNGSQYRANWWTNTIPGSDSSWTKIEQVSGDGSVNYNSGTAYTADKLVSYQGHVYKAKWWTTSKPGSDSSWVLVK